jgi:NAD(P)-dependent dehydrogenase (short-subunit alcohol dehydrogenase family)
MGKLSGKRALVTGAGMGIGQGIARALAAEGAAVVLHYAHSREGAEVTAREIEQASNAPATTCQRAREKPGHAARVPLLQQGVAA